MIREGDTPLIHAAMHEWMGVSALPLLPNGEMAVGWRSPSSLELCMAVRAAPRLPTGGRHVERVLHAADSALSAAETAVRPP